MPMIEASEVITRLTTARNIDTTRGAGDPFKLPASLRTDVDGDLAELVARETDTSPAEGARAGAAGAKRVALDELERQHRGGYRGIAALDEDAITAAARLQVFESYGWPSGEIGEFSDARRLALARLAPTISAAEVGGVATRLYTTARLARIAAQLAIIDALESPASGADRETATLRRDTALGLAGTTLLRVRFFYCSATRDADSSPELTRIGYQPRRAPGEGPGGGEEPAPSLPLPVAPQNGSVGTGNPGSGEVNLSWQASPAVEQVTDYNVYRDGVLVATVQGPSATIGGLTSGEAVTLTVRAVNATGEGPGSEAVTGTAGLGGGEVES